MKNTICELKTAEIEIVNGGIVSPAAWIGVACAVATVGFNVGKEVGKAVYRAVH